MSISMDADDECSRVPIGVQVGRFDSSSKCECNAFLNQDLAVQRHGPRLVLNMFSNLRVFCFVMIQTAYNYFQY